jgi:hypothetical protein
MKPNEALQILIKHQAWRKGEHDEATEPKDLTEAMNVAIEALESVSKADNGEVKSAETILENTHSFLDDSLGRCYEKVEVLTAMHEYHNQFQLNANNE